MKYIFGNWKMYLSHKEAVQLAVSIAKAAEGNKVKVALFPAFTTLHAVHLSVQDHAITLGAQDCSPHKSGAFTGDISADMLKESGCQYVLAGHSERRAIHGESSALVRAKAMAALEAGLTPVICVGENLSERESGHYLAVITSQVKESLPELMHSDRYIIAYEPVWAIGTGKVPTLAEISEVHKMIASLLDRDTSVPENASARTPVLYGGSVKVSNAEEIMETDYVDGVLVGGASLNAEEFSKIIQCA